MLRGARIYSVLTVVQVPETNIHRERQEMIWLQPMGPHAEEPPQNNMMCLVDKWSCTHSGWKEARNRQSKLLLKCMAKATVDFLTCFTSVWNLVQVRLLQRSCFSVLGLSEMLWGASWGDCCVCCTHLSISPQGDWNYPLLSHGPPHVCQLLVILLFLLSTTTGFDLANASNVLSVTCGCGALWD